MKKSTWLVLPIMLVISTFVIYLTFFKKEKFQLPDSPDGILSISIYDYSYLYGNNRKDILDREGIGYIIDALQQVEVDFSRPRGKDDYGSTSGRELVLYYEDGTEYVIHVVLWGSEKVMVGLSEDKVYWGTWPDSEKFFWNLDYPIIHLTDGWYTAS
ncbi:MAG: hypothetical protein HFF42_09535 [Lawsonibacter sp.]|jgi:hypothetical protein|nr:hypothetical protein [Lawsonibacter sp.]